MRAALCWAAVSPSADLAVLVGGVDDDLAAEPAGGRERVADRVPGDCEDDDLAEVGRLGRRADAGGVADLSRQRLVFGTIAVATEHHLVTALGELRGAVAADVSRSHDADLH
jgi:hypothetical protein